MDVQTVLLWFGLMAGALAGLAGGSVHWRIRGAVVVAIAAALVWQRPLWAGLGTAITAGLLIALPVLMLRWLGVLVRWQRYRAAAVLSQTMRLFLWDGAIVQQARLFAALARAKRLGPEAAVGPMLTLAADRTLPPTLALTVAMHQRRLADDWAGFLADAPWSADLPVGTLAMRMRALAALGRVPELIDAYTACEPEMRVRRRMAPHLWTFPLLWLLAACGREASLRVLMRGPLGALNRANRALVEAFAAYAAGDASRGRALLEPIEHGNDRDAAAMAARMAATPPPPAHLTDRQRDVVLAAEADLAEMVTAHRRRLRPWITYALIALNVAVFALEIARGGSENERVLDQLGALWPPSVLQAGQWWRVATAATLHFGWVHLTVNMLGLLVIGAEAERAFGRWRLAVLYALAGAGSMSLIVAMVRFEVMQPEVVVGASGAIMGLVGALTADLSRQFLRGRAPEIRRRLTSMLFAVVAQTAIDIATPRISFAGHASGLAVGFIAGLALFRRSRVVAAGEGRRAETEKASVPAPPRNLPRRQVAIGAGIVATAFAAGLLGPRRREAAIAGRFAALPMPTMTPTHLAALRALRFAFVLDASGFAPAVDPEAPYGSHDPLADLRAIAGPIDEAAAWRLHGEVLRLLPAFCVRGEATPGAYALPEPVVRQLWRNRPPPIPAPDAVFDLSSDHLILIRALRWVVPPPVELSSRRPEDGWPGDAVDPARPFGPYPAPELGMASALGLWTPGQPMPGPASVARLRGDWDSLDVALTSFVRIAIWPDGM